jgi:hypothetical protein
MRHTASVHCTLFAVYATACLGLAGNASAHGDLVATAFYLVLAGCVMGEAVLTFFAQDGQGAAVMQQRGGRDITAPSPFPERPRIRPLLTLVFPEARPTTCSHELTRKERRAARLRGLRLPGAP